MACGARSAPQPQSSLPPDAIHGKQATEGGRERIGGVDSVSMRRSRLLAGVLLGVWAAPIAAGAATPEPAAAVDLAARVVARVEMHDRVRVEVELTATTADSSRDVRIDVEFADRLGARRASGETARELALRPRASRRLRYTFDLERGFTHHLIFVVRPGDDDEAPPLSSAGLRIELDPRRGPRRLPGLVEYRARILEDTAP